MRPNDPVDPVEWKLQPLPINIDMKSLEKHFSNDEHSLHLSITQIKIEFGNRFELLKYLDEHFKTTI